MHRKIAALEMIEPDDRAAYIATDDGGYELHPDIAGMIDEQEAKLAEMRTKVAAMQADTRDLVTKRDMRKALIDAGVAPHFHAAISAHMRERSTHPVSAAAHAAAATVARITFQFQGSSS